MQGSSETILVVDDDALVRRIAVMALERQGYTVFGSRCGLRGLECFREHPDEIQLVLTDVVMPQMSGPEMVNHILQERQHVKVLFMTGYGTAALLPADQEKRFAVLHKPFTPQLLLQAVRECLDQCR